MLQGMAFWGAVLLAFSYPAQILAMDRGVLDISMFLVIVTVHILALIVGHNYQAGHSA